MTLPLVFNWIQLYLVSQTNIHKYIREMHYSKIDLSQIRLEMVIQSLFICLVLAALQVHSSF